MPPSQTLRSTCQEVLALGDQQERLIEALLTLASSEQGIEQRAPFDLAEIARKVILARRREAERRGIRIDAALDHGHGHRRPEPGRQPGSEPGRQRHPPQPRRRPGRDRDDNNRRTGALAIGNTGPVIPPGEVDRLFQPFQHLGDQRVGHAGGHGLGLAIVRAIAACTARRSRRTPGLKAASTSR